MDLMDYFAANIGAKSNIPNWYSVVASYYQYVNGRVTYPNPPTFKGRWTYLSSTKSLTLSNQYLSELIKPDILSRGLQNCTECIYNIMFYGGFSYLGGGWNNPHAPARDAFCGFHTRFAFQDPSFVATVVVVGDPTTTTPPNDGCISNGFLPTINGDYAADSMVTTYAHELAESITDPDCLTGWVDFSEGEEIADKCNADYADGSWNYIIGDKKFLVQLLWQRGVGCVAQVSSK